MTPEDETAMELRFLVVKTMEARAGRWPTLSAPERYATAVILNREDWLSALGVTLAQARERIAAPWRLLVPRVAAVVMQLDALFCSDTPTSTLEIES